MAGARALALADLLGLAPVAGGGARAEAPPARVVSMNLCTDLLAMLLAAPGQLVSVSHVASDPVSSPLARAAAALPPNRASAEQIYLMRPDLVLAGAYDPEPTVAMLRRLGVRVERFPLETDFADIRAHLRRMGELLGREAAAEAAIARFDAALGTPPPGPDPRAMIYYAGGFTSGAGTLADAILTAAGFRNAAAEIGLRGLVHLPLESLILARPDLVVAGQSYAAPARAQEILGHPALAALGPARRATIADNLWTCGTPFVAQAVAELRALRTELAPR